MKIKWSWILVLVMAGFIAMIVSFGVVMMRSDSQLYEDDYYQKGEDYAQRMDATRKGKELLFEFDRSSYTIQLSHPDSSIRLHTLRLLKLSDAKEDFSVKVEDASGMTLRIPIKPLKGEDWVMEASGTIGDSSFFRKERL